MSKNVAIQLVLNKQATALELEQRFKWTILLASLTRIGSLDL